MLNSPTLSGHWTLWTAQCNAINLRQIFTIVTFMRIDFHVKIQRSNFSICNSLCDGSRASVSNWQTDSSLQTTNSLSSLATQKTLNCVTRSSLLPPRLVEDISGRSIVGRVKHRRLLSNYQESDAPEGKLLLNCLLWDKSGRGKLDGWMDGGRAR